MTATEGHHDSGHLWMTSNNSLKGKDKNWAPAEAGKRFRDDRPGAFRSARWGSVARTIKQGFGPKRKNPA